MINLTRWLSAILLVIGLGWGPAAFAQKVLLLTSNTSGPGAERRDAVNAITNLVTEFSNAGATVEQKSVLSTPSSISSATFNGAGGPYDIAIVASAYSPIDPSNWTVLQSAVENRWANAIVFFVDGCCVSENGNNARQMVDALKEDLQNP